MSLVPLIAEDVAILVHRGEHDELDTSGMLDGLFDVLASGCLATELLQLGAVQLDGNGNFELAHPAAGLDADLSRARHALAGLPRRGEPYVDVEDWVYEAVAPLAGGEVVSVRLVERKAWDRRFESLFTSMYWSEDAPETPVAGIDDRTRRSIGEVTVALATAYHMGRFDDSTFRTRYAFESLFQDWQNTRS
ncbi:MAG: hypothetical protein AAGA42_03685 [Actinomycetota bacterium]